MIIKIPLSDKYKILIKEEQSVDFDTLLVKKVDKKDLKIHLAQELDIQPSKIFLSMKKNVGEKINKGDILAVKKSFLSEKKYVCDFDGIIKEINHDDGSVIITSSNEKLKPENSFFKGIINKIQQNEIELKVETYVKYELKESNENFGGEVLLINNKSISDVKEESAKNKIIITKRIEPYNQVRLEVLGAKGYVTLENLRHKLEIPHAMLLKENDLNDISKTNLPYCTIVKQDNLIYFYK